MSAGGGVRTIGDLRSGKATEAFDEKRKKVSFTATENDERSSLHGLFPLYSGASGALVLVLSQPLSKFACRRTDQAVAVPLDVIKRNLMVRGPLKRVRYLSRPDEKQFRYVCPDSGIRLGYQCFDWDSKVKPERPFLYVYEEMLVSNPAIVRNPLLSGDHANPTTATMET